MRTVRRRCATLRIEDRLGAAAAAVEAAVVKLHGLTNTMILLLTMGRRVMTVGAAADSGVG